MPGLTETDLEALRRADIEEMGPDALTEAFILRGRMLRSMNARLLIYGNALRALGSLVVPEDPKQAKVKLAAMREYANEALAKEVLVK